MTQTNTGKFNKIHPKSKEDLTKATEKKFIIKIGADYCRPCHALDAFIKNGEYSPPCDISIYAIQADGLNSSILEQLPKELTSRSIPYCCVTDSSLKKIDSILGYDRESFIAFIEKNFGNGQI